MGFWNAWASSVRPAAAAPATREALVRGAALRTAGTAALTALLVILAAKGLGAFWAGLLAVPLIAGWSYRAYRLRRVAIDRNRTREAELSIRRVAETMARAEREEELVHQALDAIARAIGIPHWAIYLRRGPEALELAALRGLPPDAEGELAPDPVGPVARSPASRAAWLGEMQILRDGDAASGWSFPGRVDGLGARPVVVSMPLFDGGALPIVLQCFLPKGADLDSEQSALLRWMGAQLSSNLKRLRLERRDQILASFMMSTGEILMGIDLAGEVTHANAAAERALGASAGGLVGRRFDQLVTAPHGGEPAASLLERVRSGGEWAGDIWFSSGDGGRFRADARLSPDRSGASTAMVLVGRDVTERREQEEALRRGAQELALVNEELHRLNRELRETQRLQNDFLANTSHELRTPLNGVIGFASLLEQGMHQSEEERADFARSIRDSAEHLLGVINDLLDLAKVASGRFELNLVSGDLVQVIRAAAESVGPQAARKGLAVHVDAPAGPLLTALDPARMRQVMLNVLGNAVKFTDKGDVRVRAWRDPDSEEARVVVLDTGIGIAPDRQARLFTRFVQADSTYNRRHTGTGLGLAITRALVETMGGTITVESEGLGKGTRVTLAFPAPVGPLSRVGRAS